MMKNLRRAPSGSERKVKALRMASGNFSAWGGRVTERQDGILTDSSSGTTQPTSSVRGALLLAINLGILCCGTGTSSWMHRTDRPGFRTMSGLRLL